MLCSKCHKDIPQGKEIQIEGTIFCKKCAQKDDNKLAKKEIIAKCHTCPNLIYNNEGIYESSIDNLPRTSLLFLIILKYIMKINSTEKVIECEKCYWERKIRYEKWKKRLKKRGWFLIISEVILFLSVGYFFYPEFWKEKVSNFSPEVMINFIIILISLTIANKIILSSFASKTSKYKIRNEKRKTK